jgi:CheY-like chemotaxis protein
MANEKIVIVDDDQDIRDSVQVILESRGYTVVGAADKETGIAVVKAEKPDLIILDVMMESYSDGFELARAIKEDAEFKDTPIVMMTGAQEKTGIDFKSAAGDSTWLPVNGFLDKPVEPNTLLEEIAKHLS